MKERNYSIDILKFMCAALIVVLHTNCKWHDAVLPLTRCAVPCFLMVSGFLLYSEEKGIGRERLLRNIKHIVHIILWSTALFAMVKEAQSIHHQEDTKRSRYLLRLYRPGCRSHSDIGAYCNIKKNQADKMGLNLQSSLSRIESMENLGAND